MSSDSSECGSRAAGPSGIGKTYFYGGANSRPIIPPYIHHNINSDDSLDDSNDVQEDDSDSVSSEGVVRGGNGDRGAASGGGDDDVRGAASDGGDDVRGAGIGAKGDNGADHLSVVKPGRSRKRNFAEWEKNISKKKRNLGKEYIAYASKKTVEARKVGLPCSDGCFEEIGVEKIYEIFNNFWAIGDYNTQNTYLQRLVRAQEIKRKRTKKEVSRRTATYSYHVKVDNKEKSVCRKAFLLILGIKSKKLEVLVKKMSESTTCTPVADKRDKRPSPRAVSDDKVARVHKFIDTLPVVASHYTRAHAPHQRYLEAGSNIKELYVAYVEWYTNTYSEGEVVSARYFRTVFIRDYNIVFQAPMSDVCTTCETKGMELKRLQQLGQPVGMVQADLDQHKAKAKSVQAILSAAEEAAKHGVVDPECREIAIDLQQTLPCPHLRAGMAYYKRKLWLYNFCVYDISKQQATMFVWEEVTAARGADEMASCLMKWLTMKVNDGQNFTKLRVFCDNCAGQNKNIFMVLAALRLVHAAALSRVEFVFMVSGHSFLPCDRFFGHIEKKVRNQQYLSCPAAYRRIIANAVRKKNIVVEMQRQDFLDVRLLKRHITSHQVPGFSKAAQLVVDVSYQEGYLIKTSNDDADVGEGVTRVRVMPGKGAYSRNAFNLSAIALLPKYPTDRLLKKEKLTDLQHLYKLLDQEGRRWMDDLIASQASLQEEGSSEEVDDPDDTTLDYVSVTRRTPP